MFKVNQENKKLIYIVLIFLFMITLSKLKSIPAHKEPEAPIVEINNKPISDKEISIINTNEKIAVFTFDGGGGNNSLNNILNVLDKFKIKGTFFLTGKWIENNPLLTVKIHNSGHEIFNHTMNHPHLTTVSDEEMKSELNEMNISLKKIIGIDSKPYFRPPYGDRDERVKRIAYESDYQSVYWTIDALDWMESEGMTEGQVRERIINGLKPGVIYLMHLGDNITGNILESVFYEIKGRGYEIVSLTQAYEKK